jgi:hypothetical protein
MQQPYRQPDIVAYSALLVASFQQQTGQHLLSSGPNLAQRLYEAPFVVISHGMQADPVFCYANLVAQQLWQMDWAEFTAMPSRLSAEPMLQAERDRLLDTAHRRGYVENFKAIRIAKNGQRFEIEDNVLWNVVDAGGVQQGQACVIRRWIFRSV